MKRIKPNYFTKGGDRIDKQSIPEWEICKKLNINIITNVDDVKYRASSSSYLNSWIKNNG